MRNAVGNQLHALAMGEGICRKKQLFSKKGRTELEGLNLEGGAGADKSCCTCSISSMLR